MKRVVLSFVFCIALVSSVFLFTSIVRTDAARIVISEIGAYEPSGQEWIEVVNVSDIPIDMTDWKFFEADTNHALTIVRGSMILAPGDYAIITQNDTVFIEAYPSTTASIIDSSWSTLNESGESIGLKDASGTVVELFTYTSATAASLERIDLLDAEYSSANWKEHPDNNSVGVRNYWYEEHSDVEENQYPVARITAPTTSTIETVSMFDGSASSDLDGSIDTYAWYLEDVLLASTSTLAYTFTTTGTYTMTLLVTDNDGATASTTHSIDVFENESTPTATPAEPQSLTQPIVINEFLPNPNQGNEWIELYNAGTTTITLDGYILMDGVGSIASPTGTLAEQSFVVVELTISKLNNTGDIVQLSFGTTTIDSIAYGAWESSDHDAPEKGNTLARTIDGGGVFQETTIPTKGGANSINPPGGSGGAAPISGGGGEASTEQVQARDVVINELLSDPSDGAVEFVELYNTTDHNISVEGWILEDGSEAQTILSGSIPSVGFLTITSPKGNLNNTGDRVVLSMGDGTILDAVSYGAWDDGNISDNASRADDPASLARSVDGQDSDYDLYDFVITHTPTPGAPNIIATERGETIDGDVFVDQGAVLLSELLPNPIGSDTTDEFIELYNAGNTDVSLDGWKLGDGSTRRYSMSDVQLKAGAYMVLKREMTNLALNNSGGETVTLYHRSGTIVDAVTYQGSAPEGESYAKDGDTWKWTTTVTAGDVNTITGTASAPVIAIDVDTMVAVGEFIPFDASDTVDTDSDMITFQWDFGDGRTNTGDVVEHVYMEEGVYTVIVTATDEEGNVSNQEVVITVKNGTDYIGGYVGTAAVTQIQITECLPNPEGSDTTEFIELFNPTSEDIDISELKLDDEEGGSRAYTIPDGTIITAGSYMIFGKQDTKIALNNTDDSVRLLYPNGTILQSVAYDGATEGASYSRTEEGNWIWTSTQTPGRATIATVPILASKRVTTNRSNYVKPVIETTLEHLRSEDIGDVVRVTGVVAVEPGVLGSQYFYIVGSPGVQVYMYKKDFPELQIGDRITVTGEISEAGGETRVKLSEQSDIEKVDHIGMPTAVLVEIADIGEPYEGWLVGFDGEITEIKSSYMYVDDGTAEVKVYFKRGAGIPASTYEVGELVRITGIVSQTKDGYQVLPRFTEDIVTTGFATAAVIEKKEAKQQEQAETIEKYLTATAGGLTAILLGLLLKTYGGRLTLYGTRVKKFLIHKK